MSKPPKNSKIIVAGLPKTGTSTLAIMLRILGYSVSGPEIDFIKGDYAELETLFAKNNAFQDFPWCFEWQHFLSDENVKIIVLYRDPESWWQSFYNSYGKKGTNYLSHSYINVDKTQENKQAFLDYYNNYYSQLEKPLLHNKDRFLFLNIQTISWKELCIFLKEPLPKNLWGKVSNIPHSNKKNFKRKRNRIYVYGKKMKYILFTILGERLYYGLSNLINRNN